MAQVIGRSGTYAEKREEKPTHDWGLIVSAIALYCVGLTAIGSFSHAQGTADVWKQLMNGALGLVVFLVFNLIPLDFWRKISPGLYIGNLALLALVLVIGEGPLGVKRWINLGPIGFQPSELTKILLSITLAAYFAKRHETLKSPLTIVGALLHIAPVVALVFLQPHNAAAFGLVCITLAAAIYAGVPAKHFPLTFLAIGGTIVFLWITGIIPEYARSRITTAFDAMVHGEKDTSDTFFQQTQGEIAIGSGGPSGTGFLNGEQVEAGTVPEQQTDFVFTIIGEEWGFVGSLLVLGLFTLFFFRVWLITFRAESLFARVLAGALFTILAFHTVVNLAMVLQLGPVIGLWLPFVSYGGTALWMCLAAVALLDQCGRN